MQPLIQRRTNTRSLVHASFPQSINTLLSHIETEKHSHADQSKQNEGSVRSFESIIIDLHTEWSKPFNKRKK